MLGLINTFFGVNQRDICNKIIACYLRPASREGERQQPLKEFKWDPLYSKVKSDSNAGAYSEKAEA